MGTARDRQRLTSEEIAERENEPNALTRRYYLHPWRNAAVAGATIAAWCLVLGAQWPVALIVGAALTTFMGLVWRAGGPGQRWRRKLRAKDRERFGDKRTFTFAESLRAHPFLFGGIIAVVIGICLLAVTAPR